MADIGATVPKDTFIMLKGGAMYVALANQFRK